MKIAIELNGVIRDINTQILDYYVKDINKEFDKTSVNTNLYDFVDNVKFENQTMLDKFMYEDYVYEIFGCAPTMSMHLPNTINTFHLSLPKNDELMVFSLMESGLSIQSTYFFLSKIGCKIRECLFPKKYKEIWNHCDVVITANKNIVRNKPDNKIVVLIEKPDNRKYRYKADLLYNDLTDLCNDSYFITKIKEIEKDNKKSNNIFVKLLNNIKNKFIKK